MTGLDGLRGLPAGIPSAAWRVGRTHESLPTTDRGGRRGQEEEQEEGQEEEQEEGQEEVRGRLLFQGPGGAAHAALPGPCRVRRRRVVPPPPSRRRPVAAVRARRPRGRDALSGAEPGATRVIARGAPHTRDWHGEAPGRERAVHARSRTRARRAVPRRGAGRKLGRRRADRRPRRAAHAFPTGQRHVHAAGRGAGHGGGRHGRHLLGGHLRHRLPVRHLLHHRLRLADVDGRAGPDGNARVRQRRRGVAAADHQGRSSSPRRCPTAPSTRNCASTGASPSRTTCATTLSTRSRSPSTWRTPGGR